MNIGKNIGAKRIYLLVIESINRLAKAQKNINTITKGTKKEN